MFPCPVLAVGFLALADVVEDWTFGFGGATSSSSEKDSHAGSSFVTITQVSLDYMINICR